MFLDTHAMKMILLKVPSLARQVSSSVPIYVSVFKIKVFFIVAKHEASGSYKAFMILYKSKAGHFSSFG